MPCALTSVIDRCTACTSALIVRQLNALHAFTAILAPFEARLLAAMTARFQARGLRDEWDSTEFLRNKLRAGEALLSGNLSDFSINRCVLNVDVMTPVVTRSTACGHKRPEVESLRLEVENLYSMNQREADESHTDDMAWEIRKLLTFIKRKAQRREVSMAPRLIAYRMPGKLSIYRELWQIYSYVAL